MIYDTLIEKYQELVKLVGEGQLREIERMILLDRLDHYWREHLRALDHIKESIGWRGYGQRDPVVEFKKEAYQLFEDFLSNVENGVVDSLMNYYRYVKEQVETEGALA